MVPNSEILETTEELSRRLRLRLRINRQATIATLPKKVSKMMKVKSKGKEVLCENVINELFEPLMVIVCLLV